MSKDPTRVGQTPKPNALHINCKAQGNMCRAKSINLRHFSASYMQLNTDICDRIRSRSLEMSDTAVEAAGYGSILIPGGLLTLTN